MGEVKSDVFFEDRHVCSIPVNPVVDGTIITRLEQAWEVPPVHDRIPAAAESAIRAALMALEGITIPAGEGLVGASIDQSIRNLSRISEAMREVDRKFLEILNERKILCHNTTASSPLAS